MDSCYNIDEPCKHFAKPVKTDHVLYYFIYIKYPEQANL